MHGFGKREMNNPWEEIKLDEVHSQMEQDELVSVMEGVGYQKILEETEPLPNGKALLRIDFKKGKERTYGIN